MRAVTAVQRLLLLFALLVLPLASQAADKGGAARAKETLQAGKPAVIAVIDRLPRPDKASETYADWAAYLNEFAAANPDLVVVAVEARDYDRVFQPAAPLQQGYATIFARAPGQAVAYSGTVLESFVYQAGLDYLRSPDARSDERLFRPFDLRPKTKSRR
jgi:hypothetical protein